MSEAHPHVVADRYELQRLLGEGGMGSVHEVLDLATGRHLALKRLSPGAGDATRALFEREYQTLSELRHPNIVEAYDYGVDGEGPFYTMELVDGRDLTKEAPLPWREACLCLRDVASLLSFLHARRLLHRDLSTRNLLRTGSGRLKLIDFGALTAFGVAPEVVGTPPFVPPEAVLGATLDQRADLFALGALGFWLITGAHAFPARNLAELRRLHAQAATPASLVFRELWPERPESIPDEFDVLLASLLALSPLERPTTAAFVIDRLRAIADLEPEGTELSMRGYLQSNAFVGRGDELAQVLLALEDAQRGAGHSLLIESEPGLGRTRLVQQLTVRSRLRGALTLRIDARHAQRPFGAAGELALGLLRALPNEARAAAEPSAALLAHLSDEVRTRLSLPRRTSAPHTLGEHRVAVLEALCAWVQRLCQQRCLAVFVDDAHAIDEESRGALVTLAESIAGSRLLLVATAVSASESSFGFDALRTRSTRLSLAPLTSAETLELLRSVFGEVPYLERCAERLFRTSKGNPAHCLALAQQLVQTDLARYVDGTWMLPAELDADRLPSTREDAYLARIARLSVNARALAEIFSVSHEEALDLDDCHALSELDPTQTQSALQELCRAGVLVEGESEYVFAHGSAQRALFSTLTGARRAAAHLKLGALWAEREDGAGLTALRAAVHLLHGGEQRRALPLLKRAVRFYASGDVASQSSLHLAAPLFEQAHQLLSERRADGHAAALVLGVLALCGYYVDRRYAARYGEAAVRAYEQVLKLALARKLARFVGAKLALVVTLLLAALSAKRSHFGVPLKESIAGFTRAIGALSGTATACMEPRRSRRYADALSPFRPLGPDHIINLVHETATLFAMLVEDRIAETSGKLKAMLGRLERGEVLGGPQEGVRKNYLAGCYLSLGVQACWQDEPEALRIADELEHFSPMHAMTADHFRAAYYTNQGDLERAAGYRRSIELHAVRLGSAWQVELWAPADAAKTAMRLNDPLYIRRAFQDLSRLGAELPSMAQEERRARGMYHVLNGQFEKAVQLLELDEEPLSIIGWTFTRGALARAYNGLGQHARAKAICEQALALRTPGDLRYPVIGLNVQIELARAQAGLGDHEAARTLLDGLLALHAPAQGAVTLGSLHEARAWAALREGKLDDCREHLSEMESYYRPLGLASLLDCIAPLARALDDALHPGGVRPVQGVHELSREMNLATHVHSRLEKQSPRGFVAIALESLGIARELSGATDGFLVISDASGPAAHLGAAAPNAELIAWAERALATLTEEGDATRIGSQLQTDVNPLSKELEEKRYIALDLHDDALGTFGVMALGFEQGREKIPSTNVMCVIAGHLASAHATATHQVAARVGSRPPRARRSLPPSSSRG